MLQEAVVLNGHSNLKSSLHLPSLEIKGFRAFRHLIIERLGRVNLIVGKNGIGKSSLLEALQLYATYANADVIDAILANRNEDLAPPQTPISASTNPLLEKISSLRYLLYQRSDFVEQPQIFQIGPVATRAKTLTVTFHYKQAGHETAPPLVVKVQVGEQSLQFGYLVNGLIAGGFSLSPQTLLACSFVPTAGIDGLVRGRFWDQIALTAAEEDVLDILRIVAPNIERLNFVATKVQVQGRIPFVKVADLPYPVPLQSLGNGLVRLLDLAMGMAVARDGLLLIDEIENGLHYSVQPDLWRLILQAASRLNVQVFATTHSWDCVTAFQQVLAERATDDGLLIRLQRKRDAIVPTIFDATKLAIATREQIEIR